MSQLSLISRQTWLRSLLVSTLAFFMVTGVVFGATTISSNINTGGTLTVTGTSTLNGTADLNGQADIGDGGDTVTINGSDVSLTDPQWSVTGAGAGTFTSQNVGGATATHIDGANDLLVGDSVEVDSNVYVQGTLFAYGPTYLGNQSSDAISVVGTASFNNDTVFGDGLSVATTATFDGDVILGDGGDNIAITDASWSISGVGAADLASLTIGSPAVGHVDGTNDVMVSDDLEVDGITYLDGQVYTYGPTSIGDSAIEAHTVTGIMSFNQDIILDGDATLGDGGGTITIGDGGATDSVVITDANWSITNPGAATFTGLDVDGNVNLGSGTGDTVDVHDDFTVDGDVILGDPSLSSAYIEIQSATNDVHISGGGSGTISLGEGGGDQITIGGGGDQITIGGGTDQVDVDTGSGTLTVGTNGAEWANIFEGGNTLDFGSIATNDCDELTLTVTGASTGNPVFLGAPSGIENDLSWSGFVSAADTVTVRLCNIDAVGATDPASAYWSATVFQLAP